MKFLSKIDSRYRFALGLAAAIAMSLAMGQGVEIVGWQVSIMSAVIAIAAGFSTAKLLTAASPRCEQSSSAGTAALIIMLATYVLIGRTVLMASGWSWFGAYLAAGVILAWLVLTSVAETPLLTAFGTGGFMAGFVGLLCSYLLSQNAMSAFFSNVNQTYESAYIYTAFALICAIPGAFAASAARLSGWGLMENTIEEVWCFSSEGRLSVRQEKGIGTRQARSVAKV